MVTEEELDVKEVGIYPKFEIQIPGNDGRVSKWWTSYIYRFHLRGIKSEKLQKLAYLMYIISYPSSDAGISDMLRDRVYEIKKGDSERYHREIISHDYKSENLEVMKIEEIMRVLNCSRRTAIDYKNTLRSIFYYFR